MHCLYKLQGNKTRRPSQAFSLDLYIKRDILSFGSSDGHRGQYLTSAGFLMFSPPQNGDPIGPSWGSLLIKTGSSVHEAWRVNGAVYAETDVKAHKAPFVCYSSLTSALHSIILLRWMQYSTLPFTQTKPKIDWKVSELKISCLDEETSSFCFMTHKLDPSEILLHSRKETYSWCTPDVSFAILWWLLLN